MRRWTKGEIFPKSKKRRKNLVDRAVDAVADEGRNFSEEQEALEKFSWSSSPRWQMKGEIFSKCRKRRKNLADRAADGVASEGRNFSKYFLSIGNVEKN